MPCSLNSGGCFINLIEKNNNSTKHFVIVNGIGKLLLLPTKIFTFVITTNVFIRPMEGEVSLTNFYGLGVEKFDGSKSISLPEKHYKKYI